MKKWSLAGGPGPPQKRGPEVQRLPQYPGGDGLPDAGVQGRCDQKTDPGLLNSPYPPLSLAAPVSGEAAGAAAHPIEDSKIQ